MLRRRFGSSRLRFRGRAAPRSGCRAPFLLSAALGIGLALVCIWAFDASIRPVLVDMATAKTRNVVTEIVNRSVEDSLAEQTLGYDDMVTLQTDSSGRITAMTTNTVQLNALRTEILGQVVEQVDDLDAEQLGIPLGNLTGLSSVSGWGPTVPVRVVAVAHSDAAFENTFSAAGINQTLHQVMLDITVTVRILIPGETVETVIDTRVCVAETVVVGEVTGTYLELPGSSQ